jgi:hypothetical protein
MLLGRPAQAGMAFLIDNDANQNITRRFSDASTVLVKNVNPISNSVFL